MSLKTYVYSIFPHLLLFFASLTFLIRVSSDAIYCVIHFLSFLDKRNISVYDKHASARQHHLHAHALVCNSQVIPSRTDIHVYGFFFGVCSFVYNSFNFCYLCFLLYSPMPRVCSTPSFVGIIEANDMRVRYIILTFLLVSLFKLKQDESVSSFSLVYYIILSILQSFSNWELLFCVVEFLHGIMFRFPSGVSSVCVFMSLTHLKASRAHINACTYKTYTPHRTYTHT